ncbi:MAG: histidine phosphatase family protein [Bacteroidia bacterium]|nr:histidine phosphatase family protein [Bacteroidia bacterium]
MSLLTLYFVRHGETDYNRQGIVQGSGIDSSLNEIGLLQAGAFFQHYRETAFDAVFASTLIRTHQTLSFWKDYGYDIRVHPGLNEFNWGVHEGKKPSPEQNRSFRQILQKWAEGDFAERVPEGESPIEAWDRAVPLFDLLREEYMGKTLLLCSHGRQLRVILSNLLGEGMIHMEKYNHHNTALSIVKIEKSGKAELTLLNDITHLENLKLNVG